MRPLVTPMAGKETFVTGGTRDVRGWTLASTVEKYDPAQRRYARRTKAPTAKRMSTGEMVKWVSHTPWRDEEYTSESRQHPHHS